MDPRATSSKHITQNTNCGRGRSEESEIVEEGPLRTIIHVLCRGGKLVIPAPVKVMRFSALSSAHCGAKTKTLERKGEKERKGRYTVEMEAVVVGA